jgi:uncharacterized membrane protein YfcA
MKTKVMMTIIMSVILLQIMPFSTAFASETASMPSENFGLLPFLGFMVGTAIGLSGIGGAAMVVPALIFLGVPPPVMVGTSLVFNFFTKIFGSLLHYKERNVNMKAILYLVIGVPPAALFGTWLFSFIKTVFGAAMLDSMILLSVAIVLLGIALFMIKTYLPKRKIGNSSETNYDSKVIFSNNGKIGLLSLGSGVSFVMQVASIGAGTILVPFLLKTIRSPRQVAGTSILYALAATGVGGLLHYAQGDVSLYITVLLLAGSIPGTYLGVKLAKRVSPIRLAIIFGFLILSVAILLLIKGVGTVFA